jgi:hypothetical protein
MWSVEVPNDGGNTRITRALPRASMGLSPGPCRFMCLEPRAPVAHAVPGSGKRTSAVGDELAKELRMAGPTPVAPRIEAEVGPAHLEVDEKRSGGTVLPPSAFTSRRSIGTCPSSEPGDPAALEDLRAGLRARGGRARSSAPTGPRRQTEVVRRGGAQLRPDRMTPRTHVSARAARGATRGGGLGRSPRSGWSRPASRGCG